MRLKARSFDYTFPRPALVMGILNVTPDSFSDGGRYLNPEAAVMRASEMIQEGADWIDVGGESTRPGAEDISVREESLRVFPVIEELTRLHPGIPVSIDTRKPAVAEGAVERGASIINDVEAKRMDPAMWRIVAESGAAYVIMHMQGQPQNMQSGPEYSDKGVVHDLSDFFKRRMELLVEAGAAEDQLILDFGIGFGKTTDHNLELLSNIDFFHKTGRPLLVGASRKSFIGNILNAPVEKRLPASLATAAWSVMKGAEILRVHDVWETTHVVRLLEVFQRKKLAEF